MFIKAKIDGHNEEIYDEIINILENDPLVYLVYYINYELVNYVTLKGTTRDLIYIDSYYEQDDKIYCNIYIDDYLDWDKKNKNNSFSFDDNFIIDISDGGYLILYNVKLLDDIDSIIIQ